MAIEETEIKVERKKRILFVLLGNILAALIIGLFFLLDFLIYLDPELERGLLFLIFIGLSGFVSGLVPSKITDGLISGAIYSVLFWISINLAQLSHFMRMNILVAWHPQYLIASLRYIAIAFGCAVIGIGLKSLIVLLINKLRKNKIKGFHNQL